MSEGAEEPGVVVNFASPVEAGERDAVESSIETLRRRAEGLNSLRWATDEALAAVPPLPEGRTRVEIAEDDPAAIAAHEAFMREQRESLEAMSLQSSTPPPPEAAADAPTAYGVPSEVFAIPYHYDWRWHVGSPGLMESNLATGELKVWAWGAWSIHRSDCHVGFGVSWRSDRDHWVNARSIRRSWEKCKVWSSVSGAVALAEGGMEMTVLEGSQLLGLAQDKRFRMRLNPGFWAGPEHGEHDSGGYTIGAPIEVTWFAQRGHTYQINVGAWVLAEWTDGPHASGPVATASGEIVSNAMAITLFRH